MIDYYIVFVTISITSLLKDIWTVIEIIFMYINNYVEIEQIIIYKMLIFVIG